MTARHPPWPRTWLMTDERLGGRLWEAIDGLPEGSGIVVRHYGLGRTERADLARRVGAICRVREISLAIAADVALARELNADLVHNPLKRVTDLPFSRSAHSLQEAEDAGRDGAALVFVSPVFATRSHPGQEPLGLELAARIARASGVPAIALGGMNAQRYAQLDQGAFHGWGGIDAWLGEGA